MNTIFEISEGGFELRLVGNKPGEKPKNQNFFFPAVIELHVGAFAAKKKIEMKIGDVEAFIANANELLKEVKGSASRLENLDMDFSILFESNELGQIGIKGLLFDGEARQNKLEFNTLIDHSQLSQVITDTLLFIEK